MTINHSQRPTILLIDDDITNLKVAVNHLNAYSYRILTADNGADGIMRAQKAGPDLILLDIRMPGLDGLETCRRLKANPTTATIPVIFMTALTDINDKVHAFDVGAVDYVTKPIEAPELIARVRTHLTLRAFQRDLEQQVAQRTAELTAELNRQKQLQAEKEILLKIVRQQSEHLRQHIENATPSPNTELLLKLTNREYEVLQLIAQGKSSADIADILVVAKSTITTYRKRIMTKLDLPDATALLKFALEQNI
ncbi:MAG TPA: response regulator transcription factor [Anaerolineae bacterium]|nr:response regulator transcription factor [Anaerolineae bacterium]